MPKKKQHMLSLAFFLHGFIPHSFHHLFSRVFFRGEPSLSQVGDSLEPLQAIGFSPPSREAFVGEVFVEGIFGGW